MDLDRLNFLLTETDRHLLTIGSVTPLLREIKDILLEMKNLETSNHEVHKLREEIKEIKYLLEKPKNQYENDYSKIVSLLDQWPRAIDPDLICNKDSEPDKEYRAESIIEFVITDYLKDLKFLDFGCGEGHVVNIASTIGSKISIGYDVKEQGWDRFPQKENFLLTTEESKIKENAPYDVILLYDVLDHLEGSHEEILNKLGQLLSPQGKIYVRCHPWCSRHGTHLYENNLNKAFIHLILDEVELVRLGGYSGKKTHKITHPLITYRKWFQDAGLKISIEKIKEQNIEEFFFLNNNLWSKIKEKWKGEDPYDNIKINQVDYVLTSNSMVL